MKKLFYPTLLLCLSYHTYADNSELVDSIQNFNSLQKETNKTDAPTVDCKSCEYNTPSKVVTLNAKEIDLGKIYPLKDKTPLIIILKRTAETPAKLNLSFKNSFQVCGKTYVGVTPMTGNIFFDCMFKVSEYDDQEISLDLSSLPPLKEGSETYELAITKDRIEKADYSVKMFSTNNENVQIESDKKFFGRGYNFSISKK